MRIATWNVNSARTRAQRMVDVLERHSIDVAAIQETKCSDANFPYSVFEAAGYEVAHVGFNQWNGVAILSRVGLDDVATSFPGQPGFHKDPDAEQTLEARAVGATCGGVRLWSVYVPNGREIGDRHYDYKLQFLYQLRSYLESSLSEDPNQLLALMGDINIAPRDEDVWDISVFEGKTHVTEPERAAFMMLEEAGLKEVTRDLTSEKYSYYDYKSMRFQRGEGMRIDFQFASPALARTAESGFIDSAERAGKGASDHLPVIVDYALRPTYDEVR